MNWIRKILRDWLFKAEIERVKKFEEEVKVIVEAYTLIMRSLNVGVDFHFHNKSWAVICLDGNPCYIKFFSLPAKDITEIKRFLRQYTKADKFVDIPQGVPVEDFVKEINKL